MNAFLTYTVIGVVVGCIFALSATGLVVTYTTSGIFNFAHGAIGMVAAFLYWQLTIAWGWPKVPAILFILLVAAPLFGAVVERVLVRPLEGSSLEVNLVVTLGLLVLMLGVANWFWNPTKASRTLPLFFPGHRIKVFLVYVSYHDLLVIAAAGLVAVALRVFFSRTRTGIAMRAVVDNRDLTEMAGARPVRLGQLSWALGASLAALAGILIAPLQYLDINGLTLLIINAFAAAVVGRLRSLPATVAGAFVVGLSITYAVGYLHSGFLSKSQNAIPMVVLFVVVIVMRQERLRTGTAASGLHLPRVPSLRQSLVGAAGFVLFAVVVSGFLSPVNLATGGRAVVFALALLSLVLLTGYGGQVSICQMTFVGAGAYAMGRLGHGGSLLGVVAAVGLAMGFGALLSIPTVRLRGLYLALATLAFAQAMDYVFFAEVFGSYGGGLHVARVHIPGIPTAADRSFFILLSVVFALCAVGVLAIRRSRWGRKLAALNDSPAACATLGVNINYTKVLVFSCSAGIAGLAGVFYGGVQHLVTPDDFTLFTSLTLMLTLLIGGRNSVTGALLGALFFASFPTIQHHFPSLSNVQFLMTGLAAIGIARRPNGIGGDIAKAGEQLRSLIGRRVTGSPAAGVAGVGVTGSQALDSAGAGGLVIEEDGDLARVGG